ncbi:MAG: XrtA/PEP-CTERM system histidine kinase PrsK [Gammaproteobacteria bacterium]
MIDFGLLSNLTGTLLFLILTGLLWINWRGQLMGGLLILCGITSLLFFAAIAYNAASGAVSLAAIRILELLRDVSWLVLLNRIIRFQPDARTSYNRRLVLPATIAGLALVMTLGIILSYNLVPLPRPGFLGVDTLYYGYLLISLTGLVLIEQIYRHTKPAHRWAIRYFCFGLGGIFLYDFLLYSDAVLFKRVNPDLWFARGAVNALCVPLIVVSIRRIREWKMELFISRHVIFQSSIMLMAGLYLSFMAVSGYYVRVFGGTWGGALQTVFWFAALMGLVVLLFSSDLRARIRIFLVKHFYENKYDYREEWLGFTRMLAENRGDKNVYANIIRAFADMMNCRGGAMWLADNDMQCYRCVGELHLHEAMQQHVPSESDLIKYLVETRWVINLDDYKTSPRHYRDLQLPAWLVEIPNVSLIIPLISEEELIGFILLTQSDINTTFNWEDYDLLKTMGQQTAGYIALLITTENLAEAKQFEAFNRLSAYVVHDIKNMVAQLSLICTNAKKFKDNPEFLEDAFDTIENAITKMNRLTRSLKKGAWQDYSSREYVDVGEVISWVIKMRAADAPAPRMEAPTSPLLVHAERDRLAAVMDHLVQNAQEATPADGEVELSVNPQQERVVITISDNGCGMDEEFIRERLFKPFDTTKGNAGMGIGVYESREVIKNLGGSLDVESKPGEGTLFTIRLPLAADKEISRQGALQEALK